MIGKKEGRIWIWNAGWKERCEKKVGKEDINMKWKKEGKMDGKKEGKEGNK